MAVEKIITDAPMDATGEVLSKPVSVNGLSTATFQVVFTGTPVGVFSIEATVADGVWTPVSANIADAAGAAGSRLIRIINLKCQTIRLRYVYSSGSGTLNANVET